MNGVIFKPQTSYSIRVAKEWNLCDNCVTEILLACDTQSPLVGCPAVWLCSKASPNINPSTINARSAILPIKISPIFLPMAALRAHAAGCLETGSELVSNVCRAFWKTAWGVIVRRQASGSR
jgi:hypothetical protein